MTNTPLRLTLGAVAVLGLTAIMTSQARAAQAWSCICDGERKRFLASTRHCEFRSNVPKGQWCSLSQWRSVYGPACQSKGCKLPPLRKANGTSSWRMLGIVGIATPPP